MLVQPRRLAFTLIELLVVIAIVAILTTSGGHVLYGEDIWDPAQLADRFSSPIVVVVAQRPNAPMHSFPKPPAPTSETTPSAEPSVSPRSLPVALPLAVKC